MSGRVDGRTAIDPDAPTEAESDIRSSEGASEESGSEDSLLEQIAKLPQAAPRPAEPNRTGQTLGHYRVGEKLGQGGMGIVYAAEDRRLRRKVALKVLPVGLMENVDRRARFLREARSASAIHHPNVATVFDVGESDDTVYIAMEYVEGRTLRALLESAGGKVDVATTLRVGSDIARGLAKAHRAGIVHRDVKPENVMVTPDGAAKILDFGLAKLSTVVDAHAATETSDEGEHEMASRAGRIMGTPGYMSPEQAEGAPVDARTDVYSTGVVLCEMLTGIRLRREAPSGKTDRLPKLPAPLSSVVARCLRTRVADRYADCAELTAALDRIASARGAGGIAAWRMPLATLGGAALAAMLAWVVWGGQKEDRNAPIAVAPDAPPGSPVVAGPQLTTTSSKGPSATPSSGTTASAVTAAAGSPSKSATPAAGAPAPAKPSGPKSPAWLDPLSHQK